MSLTQAVGFDLLSCPDFSPVMSDCQFTYEDPMQVGPYFMSSLSGEHLMAVMPAGLLHPLVREARVVERAALLEMGDTISAVVSEFAPYEERSVYVAAIRPEEPTKVRGVMRYIPNIEEPAVKDGPTGIKSFNDMAQIPDIPLNTPEEVRQMVARVLCLSTLHLPHVWDAATFGVAGTVTGAKEAVTVMKDTLGAFSMLALAAEAEDKVKYIASINSVAHSQQDFEKGKRRDDAHKRFTMLGYPYIDLWSSVLYDTEQTGDGMVGRPGIWQVPVFRRRIEQAAQGEKIADPRVARAGRHYLAALSEYRPHIFGPVRV